MGAANDLDAVALASVSNRLAQSIASIGPDQWTLATPCSGWDLAALIDHIAGGNWFTLAILSGRRSDDAMTATLERFAGGSATGEAAIRSLEDQAVAFLQPQVLDQSWNHMAGDLDGRQILRVRLHDLIVHSWDVAETLQPGARLPDDLVRWGLDELATDDSLTALHVDLTTGSRGPSTSGEAAAYLAVFGRGRESERAPR